MAAFTAAMNAFLSKLPAGKHEADREMADAGVSEEQLAQSNEPEFQQAVVDKRAAAEHADTAPAGYRQQEQQVIQQDRAEAGAVTTAGVAGMQGAKGAALAKLVADKGKTKSKDETRRAEVTAKVQGIFAATEADVRKILDGIDPKVDAAFEKGEVAARAEFENYVEARMSAYKKDRYSGWLGGYRWLRDKIRGMPAKVNEFYEAGRELYLQKMDGVISGVATIVGDDLTKAKQRIAQGRTEIATYVGSLPKDLQKVGSEAVREIGDKFAQLESDVDAKQESVVDALATKYVESRKGLDERIEALQAENRGLVDKAIGAIKAVLNTIRELAAMLRNVMSRVAGVVGDIIKNPIGFLDHLIAGVKGGILRFKDNILDHLRKGLTGWLFGALAEGGVELPDTFDLKGVVQLLASLFGLTWANIRNRLVKQIGELAMAAVEKGVEIFQLIATQGVGGLWQLLVEKVGNIKDMILEKVQDFVVTKVITAGITWLISLLNPAAAFIKACKLIYDVVMFFVNNAAPLAQFVDTIIDSVADIVRGNAGGVVAKIENVLGQMVPILIGFLASVLGLGGIGQKIREIVTALQKPVKQALDFVIKAGLKLAGPIIRGLKKVGGKVKAGVGKLKERAKAGATKIRDKLRKPNGANKERTAAALHEAEGVLVERPPRRAAGARIHAVSRRFDVPLHIVVESTTSAKERVHVQAMSTDSHELPIREDAEESEEIQLLDDGSTSLEERQKVLSDVRAVVQNESVIGTIFQVMREGMIKKANRLGILRKLIALGEKDGFRLTLRRREQENGQPRLDMEYYGVFREQTIKVGNVRPGGVRAIGEASVSPKSIGTGETPVKALALDFLVDPKIELAGVKGLGSRMFMLAAQHFATQYQAIAGEWYTLEGYASKAAGRPAMSKNLVEYLAARKRGLLPEEAVRETWTYRRVKDLYGGAELQVQAEELAGLDLNNPPPNVRIIRCLMKPR
jgi:hypothetical protein